MARSIVERIVSDLSGKEIPVGEAWVMTLTPPDYRRNSVKRDISEDEARRWLAKGTEVKRRGRRPGAADPAGARKAKAALATRRPRRSAAKAAGTIRRKRGTTAKRANGRRKRSAKA